MTPHPLKERRGGFAMRADRAELSSPLAPSKPAAPRESGRVRGAVNRGNRRDRSGLPSDARPPSRSRASASVRSIPNAHECRVEAIACDQRAAASTRASLRKTYRSMARTWNVLANQMDRVAELLLDERK